MNDLQKTINQYFKNRKEVVAVYLFGSYAAGKERTFSDVDVGVILYHRNISHAFSLQSQYTVVLGRQLRKDVHAVILNTAGELLLKQVFQKGVCICVNDETELRQFKMIRYSVHIVSEEGYGVPGSSNELFYMLEEHNLIDRPLTEKMVQAIGLRNLIAHEYGTINLEKVHHISKENINDEF